MISRLARLVLLFSIGLVLGCTTAPGAAETTPPEASAEATASAADATPSASPLVEQPASGDGWRLLSEPGGGGAYTIGIAGSSGEAAELWAKLALDGTPPELDYATEVLAVLGPAVSGSCPAIRLDGISFDPDRRLVFGRFTDHFGLELERGVNTPGPCTADANPHPFAVALRRDHLPQAPFTLRLIEQGCAGCVSAPEVDVEDVAAPTPSPSPTPAAPSPSVPPSEAAPTPSTAAVDARRDITLTCGDGEEFSPAQLLGSEVNLPSAELSTAFSAFFASPDSYPYDEEGWRFGNATEDRAVFLRPAQGPGAGPNSYDRISFAFERGGWRRWVWGLCRPSVVFGRGADAATWSPVGTTAGATTTFEVWVEERHCASGKPPEGRILAPDIVLGEDAITITFGVTPRPGAQDCQGALPSRYVVELPEPIGLRELRDGSAYPSTPVRSAPSTKPRTGPYPAGPWEMRGEAWSERVINLIVGPAHCDWESSNFVHMGWPLGREAQDSTEARQFIRDPLGLFGDALAVPYDPVAELPADAVFTGLRNGDLELWMTKQDEDAIYLVTGNGAERWPRASPMLGCA